MFLTFPLALFSVLTATTYALPYFESEIDYNLNQNETATNPTDYNGTWDGHTYTASPSNWRMPFYTIFLDRFVNGDPTNDNINGTAYEHDIISNQFRNGGDVQGLTNTLDYLYGMGIRVRAYQTIYSWWGTDGLCTGNLSCRQYYD